MKERSCGHEPREAKHAAFIAKVKTLDYVNPMYLWSTAVICHVMYIMDQLNMQAKLFNMPTTFTAQNIMINYLQHRMSYFCVAQLCVNTIVVYYFDSYLTGTWKK